MKYLFLLILVFTSVCKGQNEKIFSEISTNPLQVEGLIKDLIGADRCIGLLVASQSLLQRSDLDSAKAYLQKATEIAESEGNAELTGRCYAMRGMVADAQGKSDDSIRYFGAAAIAFAKIRRYDELTEVASRKAIAEERQGRIPAAIETLLFLQTEAMAGGSEKTLAAASTQKCRLHSIIRQLPEARVEFDIASGLLKPQGKASDLARLEMLEAAIFGLEGNTDRAVKMYDSAFRFYSGIRENLTAANCRFNAGLILSQKEQHDRSNTLLVEAAFHYALGGSATGTANSLGSQGANYLAMNNLPVARVLLEQTAVMHELGGNMMRSAENQILLGDLYRRLGNQETSEIHLTKAIELFKKCGLEQEGLERSRATRESVPLGKPVTNILSDKWHGGIKSTED
jgi:tetratricopeptide (TPR) repeat protein